MLPSNTRPLARLVLLSLLLTFIAARVVSILMTLHRMPDIYLHVYDTHVHHLNYGIFLLAGVGAYLLFSPGPAAPAAALGAARPPVGPLVRRATFDHTRIGGGDVGQVGVASSRIDLLVGIVIGIVIAWLYFLVWKLRYTASIRENAVQRSLAVTVGKVQEQLVPYLPEFGFNPKDARFLGSPVDLIVFDGLAAGEVRRVVFLEVKTGTAPLTARERQVRQVIEAREVA